MFQGFSSAQPTRSSVVVFPLHCSLCYCIVVIVLSFQCKAYEPLELMLCKEWCFSWIVFVVISTPSACLVCSHVMALMWLKNLYNDFCYALWKSKLYVKEYDIWTIKKHMYAFSLFMQRKNKIETAMNKKGYMCRLGSVLYYI